MMSTVLPPEATVDLSNLAAYDYDLPPGLVARYPLERRDASRMMVVDRQAETLEHQQFTQLAQYLSPGDLLVVNNTQVLPARLFGRRLNAEGEPFTGQVELLLLHPESLKEEGGKEGSGSGQVWSVLMKPAKKLAPGTRIVLDSCDDIVTVEARGEEGYGLLRLPVSAEESEAWLERVGQMPIPPYLERRPEASDKERYQTVYASQPGAQAAPTAGLHFTPETFEALRERGVQTAEVTLNVGVGTFRPVLADCIEDHRMDGEYYVLPQATAEAIAKTKANGGRVVAVGTTVVKTLETAALKQQGQLAEADSGWSELFIKPGFQFQVVDALLTNFHLPRSTLLMLVSAFANRDLMIQAYETAVAERYRFYSYGDCMLLV